MMPTVDDTITQTKIDALQVKIEENDSSTLAISQIIRCLELTKLRRVEHDDRTVTNEKRHDDQTGAIITDAKRLELNTLWLGKADTALAE